MLAGSRSRDGGKEEWLGLVSQGDGSDSPFLRHPKQAYYVLQMLWRR